MKVGIGVMIPQVRDHREASEAGRSEEEFSLEALEGMWPYQHSVSLLASQTVKE